MYQRQHRTRGMDIRRLLFNPCDCLLDLPVDGGEVLVDRCLEDVALRPSWVGRGPGGGDAGDEHVIDGQACGWAIGQRAR